MKKLTYAVLFFLLMAVAILLPSCADGECKHDNILTTVVAADCDHEGYTLHDCQGCDMEYKTDITPSRGHTLTEQSVAATCTKEGYTQYSCACGYSYKGGFLPPRDHAFRSERVLPTCTKQGYTQYTCECGYSYVANYTEPTGHTLKKTVKAPTCTEQGYTDYACNCGYSYRADYIKPMGHSFKETVKAANCTEGGYTRYDCDCGYAYLADFTKPTGHSITTTTTAPTCEEEGYTTYACGNCSYSYRSDHVAPTGHDFVMSITKRPSSTENGTVKFACACSYSYTEMILKSDVYGGYVEGTAALAQGIDVSYHNGDINWQEIKDAGIDYVIIRAGYTGTKDTKFEEYYAAAKAVGLDVGCYYYCYSTSVAAMLEDAEEFVGFIAGKQFEYPVYLDLEDASQANLGRELLTEMAAKFIGKVQASGYYCALYVNHNWLYNILDTNAITAQFDVWMARYYDQTDTWRDEFGDRTGMWQYSDQGSFGTNTCAFDLNVAYKDYPAIIKSLGYNGFTPQTSV